MKKKFYLSFSMLFISLIHLLFLSSCNGVGVAKIEPSGNIEVPAPEPDTTPPFNFSGITSYSAKTDTTVTLHWNSSPDAVAYEIYDLSSGGYTWIKTVPGPAASSTMISGLTPGRLYRFRIKAKNSLGDSDANAIDLDVTMDNSPTVPTSITRILPVADTAATDSVTLRVSGVKIGDTIKIYKDNLCATSAVATGVATGASIDIVVSGLTNGSHEFYATSTNSANQSSGCSTAFARYFMLDCPANYIPVPPDSDVGTSSHFCVAKYEMRCAGSPCVATSQASSTPWVSINQINAKTACRSLNTTADVKFDLINNPEWMTVARNIEKNPANWSGPIGNSVLARGHTDRIPASILTASSDDSQVYSGTGDSALSGWEQRRVHTLSNNEKIWDFSGNAWEWIDFTVPPSKKASWSGGTGWVDFSQLDTNIGENPGDIMLPSTYMPYYSTLSGNQGHGRYFRGSMLTGGAFLRGGSYEDMDNNGIYAISLYNDSISAAASVSFRCVYRP